MGKQDWGGIIRTGGGRTCGAKGNGGEGVMGSARGRQSITWGCRMERVG